MPRRTSSPAEAEGRGRPALRDILGDVLGDVRLVRRIGVAAIVAFGLGAAAFPFAGLATGEVHVLPILSDSMRPAFAAGDAVLVRRTPLELVREGDVIVYNIPVGDRHLTAHRVVDVVRRDGGTAVRTKGDANPGTDPWLARLEGETTWRVAASAPAVGHVILVANRPWIRSLTIWLAIASFLALALVAVWRAPTTPKEKGVPAVPAPSAG